MLFEQIKDLKKNKKPFKVVGPLNDDYCAFIDTQD